MRLSWNAHRGPNASPRELGRLASKAALTLTAAIAIGSLASAIGGCAKVAPGSTEGGPSVPTQSALHKSFSNAISSRNARIATFGDGLKLVDVRTPEGAFSGSLLPAPPTSLGEPAPPSTRGPCPAGMASIDGKFCVDRYEASLVEVLPSGEQRAYPFYLGIEGHEVRAVSIPGVKPQGHISEKQAQLACRASGKRLCKPQEWRTACMGPQKSTWGYGDTKEESRCNDHGRSPIGVVFPLAAKTWGWDQLNDEKLNQVEGTLAETGSHSGCTNGYGVYDMVGNLHEWVDDPAGTFQGGYYQDTHLNGDGCGYKTTAHNAVYHDYSTGFRCCADAEATP